MAWNIARIMSNHDLQTLSYSHTHHAYRLVLARLILAVASKDRNRIVQCYQDMGACVHGVVSPVDQSIDPMTDMHIHTCT
jgi:hypothetical protein